MTHSWPNIADGSPADFIAGMHGADQKGDPKPAIAWTARHIAFEICGQGSWVRANGPIRTPSESIAAKLVKVCMAAPKALVTHRHPSTEACRLLSLGNEIERDE